MSLLSLTNPAKLKEVSGSDTAKMLQVVMSEISDLKTEFRNTIWDFRSSGPLNSYVQEATVNYESWKDTSPSRVEYSELAHKNCKSLFQVTKLYHHLKSSVDKLIQGNISKNKSIGLHEISLAAAEIVNRYMNNQVKS